MNIKFLKLEYKVIDKVKREVVILERGCFGVHDGPELDIPDCIIDGNIYDNPDSKLGFKEMSKDKMWYDRVKE